MEEKTKGITENRRLRNILAPAAAALLLWAAVPAARAGTIARPLSQMVDASRPGERIPVIVTLEDNVALDRLWEGSRKERRRRIVHALKNRFQGNLNRSGIRGLLARFGGRAHLRPLWIVNGLALKAPPRLIRAIAASPWVQAVRLDEPVPAPTVNPLWDGDVTWNLQAVGATELWDLGHTGQGIVVALLDSGVDADHPDLAGRWRGGANSWFDANLDDPAYDPSQPYDAGGHGTAVAGILVGGDAGGSAIGMAPGARWIAAKIFPTDGGPALESEIHAAFQWLMDPDGNPETDDAPDVVNNSWGFDAPDACYEGSDGISFLTDIQVLEQAGIAVAFAAGNSGSGAGWPTSVSPANYPESLAVGSVDALLTVETTSGRGPSACDGAVYPDLVAPGDSIRTTDLYEGVLTPDPYIVVSGTSAAAPHAAGAMALLLDAYPFLTPFQLKTALRLSASDLGDPGPDNDSGFGHLDVAAAHAVVPLFDTVSIQEVDYDPFSHRLMVVATSDGQPDAALRAAGSLDGNPIDLGALDWKPWLGFYRNTFTQVSVLPTSVTVTSTGGGTATWTAPGPDVVSIVEVHYSPDAGGTLMVAAASSDEGEAEMAAETFGYLDWKPWLGLHRGTFTGIGSPPASVTVNSTKGGFATWTAPPLDVVDIVDVTYTTDDGGTLVVAATSSEAGGVTLSAETFGVLAWKPWLGFHRATFTGIGGRPDSVTVASSSGGSATWTAPVADAVDILDASYDAADGGTLVVAATSTHGGAVTLRAEGYGVLNWKSWLLLHRATFTGIGEQPAQVTVVSSGGGLDSLTIP